MARLTPLTPEEEPRLQTAVGKSLAGPREKVPERRLSQVEEIRRATPVQTRLQHLSKMTPTSGTCR